MNDIRIPYRQSRGLWYFFISWLKELNYSAQSMLTDKAVNILDRAPCHAPYNLKKDYYITSPYISPIYVDDQKRRWRGRFTYGLKIDLNKKYAVSIHSNIVKYLPVDGYSYWIMEATDFFYTHNFVSNSIAIHYKFWLYADVAQLRDAEREALWKGIEPWRNSQKFNAIQVGERGTETYSCIALKINN